MCHSKKAANLQGKDTSTNHWQPLCASPYSINWRLRASTARALFLKLPLDLQRARNRSCAHKPTSIMACKTGNQQHRSASATPQSLNRPGLHQSKEERCLHFLVHTVSSASGPPWKGPRLSMAQAAAAPVHNIDGCSGATASPAGKACCQDLVLDTQSPACAAFSLAISQARC